MTTFTSRTGKLSCSPEDVFDFVTDISNFRQFVPDQGIERLKIEKDRCSFYVSPVGEIKISLADREPFSKVVYSGIAPVSNDFSLILDITAGNPGNAVVKVTLNAEMNPFLNMMASKPISRFLEILIDKMEEFRGWKNTKA
jgi:carbon monoxide dehydrogenase subunit G